MGLGAILIYNYRLLLVVVACLLVFRRIFGKHASVKGKKRFRLRIYGAFIGNALMPLHAIIHPHTKHLIVEQLKEHAEDDQDADPTDPEVHLNRQLKRIRNGEELDQLTTLLRQHR